MRGMSGSGPLGALAQMDWLGQPVQASLWPARFDSGPGQCSAGVLVRWGNQRGDGSRTWFWSNELWGGFEWGGEVDLDGFFQRRGHSGLL